MSSREKQAGSGTKPTARTRPVSVPSPSFIKPIVKLILKRAQIGIKTLEITATEGGFSLSLTGQIRNPGPFPAKLYFREDKTELGAIDVLWNGARVATSARVDQVIKVRKRKGGAFSLENIKVEWDAPERDVHTPAFIRAVLSESKLKVSVVARVDVYAAGLKFSNLPLEKEIELEGLSSLGGALTFVKAPDQRQGPSQTSRALEDDSREDKGGGGVDIGSFDIVGGSEAEGLECRVGLKLSNPSSGVTVALGKVALEASTPPGHDRSSAVLGKVDLGDSLKLAPGTTNLNLTTYINPRTAGQAGKDFLTSYLDRTVSSSITIASSKGPDQADSIPITWVRRMFENIRMKAALPNIPQDLIASCSLGISEQVLKNWLEGDPSIPLAGTARVTITNPFSSPIQLRKVTGKARKSGLDLASIDANLAEHPECPGGLKVPGKSSTTSPEIPLSLHFTPENLISILRAEVKEKGIDIGSLETLLDFVQGESPQTPRTKPGSSATPDLNLPDLVAKILQDLTIDLEVDTEARIGEYSLDLTLRQKGVPASLPGPVIAGLTDAVAVPLMKKLLESVDISISSLQLLPTTDPSKVPIDLQLSLKGLAPLGALVADLSFEDGLEVIWEGRTAARIVIGERLRVDGSEDDLRIRLPAQIHVVEPQSMSALIKAVASSPSVALQTRCSSFQISTSGLSSSLVFVKELALPGLNGFDGLVLESFDLPRASNAASGEGEGIYLEAVARLPNNSALAIVIDRLDAHLFFEGGKVGEVYMRDLELVPGEDRTVKIRGSISRSGVDQGPLAGLFTAVLSGETVRCEARPTELVLKGGNSLPWLSEGLTSVPISIPISLDPSKTKNLISGFHFGPMRFSFGGPDQFPLVGCESISITIESPFGFPLRLTHVEGAIALLWKQTRLCLLEIPTATVQPKTDDPSSYTLSFDRGVMKEADRKGISELAAALTVAEELNLDVDGHSLRATVETPAGPVTVRGISMSASATVEGLRSLKLVPAQLTQVRIVQGQKDKLVITMGAYFNNPSLFTIVSTDLKDRISLPVYYGENRIPLGRAWVNEGAFLIKDGPANLPISFEYSPFSEHKDVAGILLSDFLSGLKSELVISGDEHSTQDPILSAALAKLELSAILKPFADKTLIGHLQINLGLNALVSKVEAFFVVNNPFELPIKVEKIASVASLGKEPLGSFDQVFSNLIVPPSPGGKEFGQATSPLVEVKLHQPLDKLVKSFISHRGRILVNVELDAQIQLGDYRIEGFKYKQHKLLLVITGLEKVSKLLSWLP